MRHFAFYAGDGTVTITCSLALPDDQAPAAVDGLTLLELAEPVPPGPHKVIDGVLSDYTPSVSLDQVKQTKWQQIIARRNAAELSELTYGSQQYEGDEAAQRRIIGASAAAMVGRLEWLTNSIKALAAAAAVTLPTEPVFSVDWTLADDSEQTLDEAGVFGLGLALMARCANVFGTGRSLRDAILEATSAADVQAIDWPDG